MRFFDLNQSETLRAEEFMFGVKFFISNADTADVLLLFNKLDFDKSGCIDLNEFAPLFPTAEESHPLFHQKQFSTSYREKKL